MYYDCYGWVVHWRRRLLWRLTIFCSQDGQIMHDVESVGANSGEIACGYRHNLASYYCVPMLRFRTILRSGHFSSTWYWHRFSEMTFMPKQEIGLVPSTVLFRRNCGGAHYCPGCITLAKETANDTQLNLRRTLL